MLIRDPQPRFTLSLRGRILTMVTGTLLLAMAVGALLIHELVTKNIIRQKMLTGEILTTSIVHDVTYATGRGDSSAWQRVVEKYVTYYRDITDLTLYSPDARTVAAVQGDRVGVYTQDPAILAATREAKPSVTTSRSRSRGLVVRSIAPVMRGSRIAGAAVVEVSMRDLSETLAEMDRQLATLMTSILLMVAVLLFFGLRGTVLVRLRRLMSATEQIRAGRFDVRTGDLGGDEIGSLAQALDTTIVALQTSRREIEDYNRRLEDRVREATTELARAYDDLKNTQGQLVLNEKMASLGVLIAGVAHEINTPVGAILNVSRNLQKQFARLPANLMSFRDRRGAPADLMLDCLRAMVDSATHHQETASYKTHQAVEVLLEAHGIEDARRRAAMLCKLNLTDAVTIERYIDCLRDETFLALAESCASMSQAAMIAETSGHKIGEIVKALKYYAHSDYDTISMIQINESIATALVLLRNQLKHDVTVSTDFAPDLPPIPCGSDIHQVWTNLLSNAHEAVMSNRDQRHPEIVVRTQRRTDKVVVTVADNGIGIAEANVARIFDPFFTTKEIGKGTGLGLSIVSGILKKHGASISVRSRSGDTVFEIELPVKRAVQAEGSAATEAGSPLGPLGVGRAA